MAKGKSNNNAAAPATAAPVKAAPAVEASVKRQAAAAVQAVHDLKPHVGFFDTLALLWVATTFWIHTSLDGTWLYHHKGIASAAAVPTTPQAFLALFQTAWKHESPLAAVYDTFLAVVKSMWKGYALSDKRIATNDVFLQALFSANLWVVAPLVVLLGYGIANQRSWRHKVQLVVTSLQIFGVALYFLTEHFNGYKNVNTKSVKDYTVYFWGANLVFAAFSGLLFLQSLFSTPQPSPKKAGGRISFAVQFFIGANIIGFGFLLAAAVGHHYLDDKDVQKLLSETLETTQQYAADAYTTASNVASEGIHQAHVAAAPYIEQAADYIHDAVHGK